MPVQKDIHHDVNIQFVHWDIHYLSNELSKHIQLVIREYPTEYPNTYYGISHLSNCISN
jgi:hypothetical protein